MNDSEILECYKSHIFDILDGHLIKGGGVQVFQFWKQDFDLLGWAWWPGHVPPIWGWFQDHARNTAQQKLVKYRKLKEMW